jgi:hypothetical protein
MEIGSHLRHQREKSGFESYFADVRSAVANMARVLRPGRYAALVLGNSIYEGSKYDPAIRLADTSGEFGFSEYCVIERPVHPTKRSFAHAGRRATSERILVMRKRTNGTYVKLEPPTYKLWPYERTLRLREAGLSPSTESQNPEGSLVVEVNPAKLAQFRKLAFSHAVSGPGLALEPTWQAILENVGQNGNSARKDSKYATHGLHPFKGKFYPQLAKALLNLAGADEGRVLLDPYCGSGTTLLEGYLTRIIREAGRIAV